MGHVYVFDPLLSLFLEIVGSWQFWISFAFITLNPIYWNSVGRFEYHTGYVSKLFCGDKKGAIHVFGCSVMCISTLRTLTFHLAMERGPKLQILDNLTVSVIGVLLACVGTFFVLASFWQLGFYGTFLGDHFGILMSAPVTAFPFSVMEHPMYWGSIIAYFGDAVHSSSASGLVLACWILVTYGLAMVTESSFTARIYSHRNKVK